MMTTMTEIRDAERDEIAGVQGWFHVGDGYCGTAGHATCVLGVGTAQGLGTIVRIMFKTAPPAATTATTATTSTTTPATTTTVS